MAIESGILDVFGFSLFISWHLAIVLVFNRSLSRLWLPDVFLRREREVRKCAHLHICA
jgi:hypothetical protein